MYKLASDGRIYRGAVDSENKEHWIIVADDSVPAETLAKLKGKEYKPNTSQTGKMAASSNLLKQRIANNEALDQKQWEEAVTSGPATRARKLAARETGPLDKLALGSMLETEKLGAGLGDIGDFLDYALPRTLPQRAIDYFTGDDPEQRAIKSKLNREKEQKNKDIIDKELKEELGTIGLLGGAIPYLMSGRYATKPAEFVFDKAFMAPIRTAAQGVEKAGAKTGETVKKTALSESAPAPIKRIAKELETNIVNPISNKVAQIKQRPSLDLPFRKDVVKDVGASGVLGGIEGGIHYDNSAAEGVGASMLGTSTGRLLGKHLEPISPTAKMSPGTSEREALDWWKDRGFRSDSGMESGYNKIQDFVNDMRRDDKYSTFMQAHDQANMKVVTEVAGEAAGITPQQMTSLTKGTLASHMDNLRNQYEALEAATTGLYKKKDINKLKKQMDDADPRYKKTIDNHLASLDRILKPGKKDGRGRIKTGKYDGTDYQKVRSRIKTAMDSAYKRSENDLGQELGKIVTFLDKGIENGLGTVKSSDWKDLNERFAMSSVLMEHGLTPNGGVDMNRLTSHLMSNDPKRLLMGKGGRIGNFHKIAQLHDLKKGSRGSSALATRSAEEVADKEKYRYSIHSTPSALGISRLNEMKARAVMAGIPNTKGYLGILPGYKEGTTGNLLRAVAQSGDAPSLVAYLLESATEYAKDPNKE